MVVVQHGFGVPVSRYVWTSARCEILVRVYYGCVGVDVGSLEVWSVEVLGVLIWRHCRWVSCFEWSGIDVVDRTSGIVRVWLAFWIVEVRVCLLLFWGVD